MARSRTSRPLPAPMRCTAQLQAQGVMPARCRPHRATTTNELRRSNQAMKLHALIPLAAALVLAGCANIAVPEPHPLPAVPTAFKGPQTEAPAAVARAQWWKAFADPQLDALTEQALENNTSIQQAGARLAEARALLRNT